MFFIEVSKKRKVVLNPSWLDFIFFFGSESPDFPVIDTGKQNLPEIRSDLYRFFLFFFKSCHCFVSLVLILTHLTVYHNSVATSLSCRVPIVIVWTPQILLLLIDIYSKSINCTICPVFLIHYFFYQLTNKAWVQKFCSQRPGQI